MARAGERQQRETQEVRNKGTQQSQSQQRSEAQSMTGQSQSQSQQSQNALASRQQSTAMPGFLNPFSFMRRFGEGMEQLFGDFGFGGLATRDFGRLADWAPQVEMFERDGELHIRADLPGMNKDNVQIELLDDAIALRGERRGENKEEREGVYRMEVSYGSFYREIPLPPNVDTSKATANFNDGVLEIRMPIAQGETRGRRLEIQDSQSQGQTKAKSQAAGAGR